MAQSEEHIDARDENGTRMCACRYKNKPRSGKLQDQLQKRLNRIVGQVNGVKNMIDENRYCRDVIIQLSAIESALKSVERMVLQNHLETCVVDEIRAGNDEIVDEAMDLIKRVAR